MKNQRFLLVAIYSILLTFMIIACVLLPSIPTSIRAKLVDIYYYVGDIFYQEEEIDFSIYETVVSDTSEWYFSTQLIAHALGGIDGIDYTNSLEAFLLAYENGIRVFEIDFDYTSDGELVAIHSWETDYHKYSVQGIPSYEEFMAEKIQDKYTPLDVASVVTLLEEYTDIYIIIDTKSDASETELLQVYIDYVNAFENIDQAEDYLSRTIIQIYYIGQYEKIQEIYPFENNLFTVYKTTSSSDSILKECLDKGIPVLTMPSSYYDKETVDLFISKGITIFSHTTNTLPNARTEFDLGVQGIYTDFLVVNDLVNIE